MKSDDMRRDIERQLMEQAKKQGLDGQIIEKVIPFTNNDVPKYLAKLIKDEKKAQQSRIIVGSTSQEAQKSFQVSEEYKIKMKALFDWTEDSNKSNYIFREAV